MAQFGDLGIKKGEWQVIGSLKRWSRDEWPMPAFFRSCDGDAAGFLSFYDEDTLTFVREERVCVEESRRSNLPLDAVLGYGAVEIRLTKLLDTKSGTGNPNRERLSE